MPGIFNGPPGRGAAGTSKAEQREQTHIAAVDGAMVHFREDQVWHEVKVGVSLPLALSGSFGPAVQRMWLTLLDYCVGMESRAVFWSRMEAHAVQNGLEAPGCRLIQLLALTALFGIAAALPLHGTQLGVHWVVCMIVSGHWSLAHGVSYVLAGLPGWVLAFP